MSSNDLKREDLELRVAARHMTPAAALGKASWGLGKASWELLEYLEQSDEEALESSQADVVVHLAIDSAETNEIGVAYRTVRGSEVAGPLDTSETDYPEDEIAGALELDVSAEAIGARALSECTDLTGEGVIVAVLDDEVAPHSDLAPRLVSKGNHSSLDWGEQSFVSSPAHATMVAGIVAGSGKGSSPAGRLRGVAPGATLWNYRISPLKRSQVSGKYSSRGVVEAILAAVHDGAQIINLSWGKQVKELNGRSDLCRAVEYAYEHGVFVVKSCGNRGKKPTPNFTSPADSPYCLTVGMTSNDGREVIPGSSYGITTFGLARPDLIAPGAHINGPAVDGSYILSDAELFTGTSYAAPHIAGAAALLLQARPDLSPEDLRQLLLGTCSPLVDTEPILQGAGLLRLDGLIEGLEPMTPNLGLQPRSQGASSSRIRRSASSAEMLCWT